MINCNHNTIHDMLCTKLYYILITRFYLFKMQVVGNVYMYVIWEDHKEHALISYNGADDTSSILDVHEAPPLPSWMSMLHLPLASRRSMQLLLLPSRTSMPLIPLLSRRSMHPCLFFLGGPCTPASSLSEEVGAGSLHWTSVGHDKSHLKVMQQAQPPRHVVVVAIIQSGRYLHAIVCQFNFDYLTRRDLSASYKWTIVPKEIS